MSLKYFGTDGIRGQYGRSPITEAFAKRMSEGLCRYLKKAGSGSSVIVIGRDTRASGASLARTFSENLCRLGYHVIDLGVLPTPQVSFAVTEYQAALGLTITASHNPAEDNGFKLFNARGTKFTPEQEAEIEACIDAEGTIETDMPGEIVHDEGAITIRYFKRLRQFFPELSLKGMKVAVDAANGATSAVTPMFLESLGAKVFGFADRPDGLNINDGVGSEHPGELVRTVVEMKCDLGIAHDGDGDRVVIVDGAGTMISGEHFMAIIAKYGKNNAATAANPLITTIQSNLALDKFVQGLGSSVIRTSVGDRNVVYEMLTRNSSFGGENSGHYVFADVLPTGDGLVAALKLLEVLQVTGKTLGDLADELTLYPSKTINLRIAEKLPMETLPTLAACRKGVEERLGNDGRILLRYSGTENKLRILVECEGEAMLQSLMTELVDAAKADLEVVP